MFDVLLTAQIFLTLKIAVLIEISESVKLENVKKSV